MTVCPITSKVKGSPFEVVLPASLKTKGCVVASEIRTLDYLQRGVRFVEKAPLVFIQDVQTIACAVLGCG
jgi:mRNA interferase MazF